jgi:hypothetical protein
MARRRLLVAALVFALGTPLALAAQRRGFFGGAPASLLAPYTGRFTFTRISYGGGGGFFGRGGGAWNHDYPDADRNLSLILDALTAIQPNLEATNILDLEDPEIFRNPILYMWEPGYWRITETGADNLRKYLLKGGFIIFDDFEAGQWTNFEAQFQQALPDAQFLRLDTSHPIFHSFFELDEINVPHPSVGGIEPAYYAVFEDNDPSKRMLALANHNNDIAEYWEWSGQGLFPVDTTNDAYKLGVNYMIYGLTH